MGMKSSDASEKTMAKRYLCVFLSLVAASALAVPPLVTLFRDSFRSDLYSHIPLIPLVSAYLLYQRRKTLFGGTEYEPRWGVPIAVAGLLLYAAGIWGLGLNQHDTSSLMVFSSLLFLFGSFVFLYGTRAFKRSAFPFLFLLFMVPIPSPLLDGIIYFLQAGSAEVTDLIFRATGIPYLREGFVFHLPGFTIEVAKECSGIRSSLALLITVVLTAHFYLQAYWQKAVLAVSVLPIVLVKNGIRISTLTFLGIYVDQRIFESFLHKSGGIFFFIPALALMGIILQLLRRVNSEE
jgi:exosortase